MSEQRDLRLIYIYIFFFTIHYQKGVFKPALRQPPLFLHLKVCSLNSCHPVDFTHIVIKSWKKLFCRCIKDILGSLDLHRIQKQRSDWGSAVSPAQCAASKIATPTLECYFLIIVHTVIEHKLLGEADFECKISTLDLDIWTSSKQTSGTLETSTGEVKPHLLQSAAEHWSHPGLGAHPTPDPVLYSPCPVHAVHTHNCFLLCRKVCRWQDH